MIDLADVRKLMIRYVPRVARHPRSTYASAKWWPAHEIGHMLIAERKDMSKRMFGVDDWNDEEGYSKHYRLCIELAAMDISKRLLCTCGRADLAKKERDGTDEDTLSYRDRGGAKAILRRHHALKLPRTREGLELRLRARLAWAGIGLPFPNFVSAG